MMKRLFKVLIPLLICVIISSLFIFFGKLDYDNLIKPKFAPPGFVFGIVWSIIYLIFFFTMLKLYKYKHIYYLYIIVLVMHIIWNFLFFMMGYLLLSVIFIILLYFISWLFIYNIGLKSKKYFYIYMIYIIWIMIATYLNLSILLLN